MSVSGSTKDQHIMPVTMYHSVCHFVHEIHDKNVILWPAKYVLHSSVYAHWARKISQVLQNVEECCLEDRHRNMCCWTVCRDQLQKELAGLRAEADKIPGKCPALPV